MGVLALGKAEGCRHVLLEKVDLLDGVNEGLVQRLLVSLAAGVSLDLAAGSVVLGKVGLLALARRLLEVRVVKLGQVRTADVNLEKRG